MAQRYVAEITPVHRKPFELDQLDAFLDGLPDGPVFDLGCGPGDVTRRLRGRRGHVVGVDLSPGMIDQARLADPQGTYEVGDLGALPPDASLAGITAFYSLIHVEPQRVPATLDSWLQALMPGGRLLIAVHVGDAAVHLDSFLDSAVDLDFHFFGAEPLRAQLETAGFEDVNLATREPYPDIEAPTRRLYAHASRP